MKIYDEKGGLLQNPDTGRGWLETVQRPVQRHPAQPGIPAVTHTEEMPGTGGLRKKVVDRPAIPARPAWDEMETVQVYHPFTPEQQAEHDRPTPEQRLTAVENAVLELMLGGEPVV